MSSDSKEEVSSTKGRADRRGRFVPGLSGKLLLLTILFVMVAEILVFVPSVSSFRRQWVLERVEDGQIAALVAEAARGGQLPRMVGGGVLGRAKDKGVAAHPGGR